jgi:toxin ParE1/3/4
MAYKIKVSPHAKRNIKNAIKYYQIYANDIVVGNFIQEIERTYRILSTFPFFKIYYKNFRGLPLSNFPFILFFEIDEDKKIILVKALFNTYQNTDKYPK